jgi:hypothetical protein
MKQFDKIGVLIFDTKTGFCPECDQRADIWNATKNHWECCYCNWSGQRPNQEKRFKQEK